MKAGPLAILVLSVLTIGLAQYSPPCQQAISALQAGTFPDGFIILDSAGHWPGDYGKYEDCVTVNNTHYCLGQFNMTLGTETIPDAIGICFPSVCNETEITAFYTSEIAEYSFFLPVLKNVSGFSTTCKLREEISKEGVGFFSFTGALAIIIVLCTIIDVGLRTREWCRVERFKSLGDVSSINDAEDTKKPLLSPKNLGSDVAVDETAELPPKRRRPRRQCSTLLKAFSFVHNIERLAAIPRESFDSLNGLRVLSMVWIIAGHTLQLIYEGVGFLNPLYIEKVVIPHWTLQIIWNADYGVDTFFFMSGFLVAYLSYKALKRGKFSLLMYYVHRYLRLTPVFVFWMLFYWMGARYLTNGPFSTAIRGAYLFEDCNKYWWTNILYINNFYPAQFQEMCMSWTWYLSNDMQFFIVAPIFVFVYNRNKLAGWTVLAIALVGCIVTTMALNYTYGFSADVFNFTTKIPGATSWVVTYLKPYVRIAPYLVGVGLAFAVEDNVFKRISVGQAVAGFMFATALMLALIFGTTTLYHNHHNEVAKNWPLGLSTFYTGFSHTAWGIAIAILTLLFIKGWGGPVKKILESKLWIVPARLTYGAYLVHPIWVLIQVGMQKRLMTYTTLDYSQVALFNVFFSYILSLGSYLLVEKPLMSLEMWLFSPGSSGE